MTERAVVTSIMAYLARIGAWRMKVHGDIYAVGIPDIIACYHGRFIAIECKDGNNKPTKLQSSVIRKINEAGGIAFVAYSVCEVEERLKQDGIL